MSQRMIGRYEIGKELGKGGMATVYLAYDPTLERDVALKVLPNYFVHDPEFSARFEREAKTVAALEHNAIVSMYDYGEDGDTGPYFVMRLMQGGSLKERIEQGAMDPAEAVAIVDRVAGALDKAHSRGIVHRDLKPGNIMFDEDGEAYLGDFGIVKLASSSESYTRTGNTLGTPAYMSPEQADGRPDIDGRSDIYALGIILYEMLAGTAPYVHDSMPRLLVMHLTQPIPNIIEARPELPVAMQDVIVKALAKEREDRFATAKELADAAKAALGGRATVAIEASPAATVEPQRQPGAAVVTAGKPEPVEAAVTAAPAQKAAQADRVMPVAPPAPAAVPAKKGMPKWVFAIIGVVLLAIVGGIFLSSSGDDSSADFGDGSSADFAVVTFVNETGVDLCGLFIVSSTFDDWGEDWLNDEVLELGDDFSVEVPLDEPQDISVGDCDGSAVYESFEESFSFDQEIILE